MFSVTSIKDGHHSPGSRSFRFARISFPSRLIPSNFFIVLSKRTTRADYDDRVPINELVRSDLLFENTTTRPCEHLPFPTPSSQMPVVWVGVLGIIRTPSRRGRWSIDEAKHHINYLELLAAFDALQCFASHSL